MGERIMGVPHPIPYQGSKRLLADEILRYFPADAVRLIEPFAGSAAVMLAALYHKRINAAVVGDLDAPLICLWEQILQHSDDLVAAYTHLWHEQLENERAYYDVVRARFNQAHRPADYLFLLARCVKAAVRYNAQGEFNQSPDNRRKGTKPVTMTRHIKEAAQLICGRVSFRHADYRALLEQATITDIVYMDPPYQGVCRNRDPRYRQAVAFEQFVETLRQLNQRSISYIVSYDGRTGQKQHGLHLPESLEIRRIEVAAGRSSQATLLGRSAITYESLYLSPALLDRIALKPHQLPALEVQLPMFELALFVEYR
jgi:DNA adenine methylase